MKTGFKDALEVKGEKPKAAPVDGKNTPWSYSMPHYDQRSSCFVNVGVDYGVGFTNPVGKDNADSPLRVPQGRVDTMKTKIEYWFMFSQAHTAKSPRNGTDRGDWHVSNTSLGMGDYYGTGVKNPSGIPRDVFNGSYVNPKSLSTPPKKMA